jgi:hypothetical protein
MMTFQDFLEASDWGDTGRTYEQGIRLRDLAGGGGGGAGSKGSAKAAAAGKA